MGFVRHNAIIVTSWKTEAITAALAKALELELSCTKIVLSPVNGYQTFFVVPDGSKLGWAERERAERQREIFRKWLDDANGTGLYTEWCEVSYGSDDRAAWVTHHAWQDKEEP